jgi:hypothetical protein
MQPAKGRQTENERAQIKKWCKLERGVKARRRKTSAGGIMHKYNNLYLSSKWFGNATHC